MHRPILFNELVLSDKLFEHCAEIDEAARNRMELIVRSLAKQYGVTEQLKAENQMEWVRAGAAGGTVLHAKGTGAKQAERFLGVSIAEEKELIIIVPQGNQAAIMKAVAENCGQARRPAQYPSPCPFPPSQACACWRTTKGGAA